MLVELTRIWFVKYQFKSLNFLNFAAQCSLKYFHVCCHHFKATKDNCGKSCRVKSFQEQLNDSIGNINLADSSSVKQHICVKLSVRAGSEVSGHHEAVVPRMSGTAGDNQTFRDIEVETQPGLSGQRRDSCLSREMPADPRWDHKDIGGG